MIDFIIVILVATFFAVTFYLGYTIGRSQEHNEIMSQWYIYTIYTLHSDNSYIDSLTADYVAVDHLTADYAQITGLEEEEEKNENDD